MQSRRLILALWFLYGVFSYLFTYTQGLGYSNADSGSGISYVRELQSSGANDNICVEVGVALAAVGLVWGAARIKGRAGLTDLSVNLILLSLQAFFITAIEMGSLYVTIFIGKNIVLALWVLAYSLLSILVLCSYRWRKGDIHDK